MTPGNEDIAAALGEMLALLMTHLADADAVNRDLLVADLDHLQDELRKRGVGDVGLFLVAVVSDRLRRKPPSSGR